MLRKAVIKDIKSIHKLLQFYGRKGDLLARPLSELYDHLRDFWVFEDDENGIIAGCCAMQFCWEDLAEIRSLAVATNYTGRGIGTLLVDRSIQEAIVFNVPKLFTLTYKPSFFEKFDFHTIDKAKLPIKIWADCIMCINFPECDETAMMKKLT